MNHQLKFCARPLGVAAQSALRVMMLMERSVLFFDIGSACQSL